MTMHPDRICALVLVDRVMLTSMRRVDRMRDFGDSPDNPYATQVELIARSRVENGKQNLTASEVWERMAACGGPRNADVEVHSHALALHVRAEEELDMNYHETLGNSRGSAYRYGAGAYCEPD